MLLPADSDLCVDGIYQQEKVLVIMVSSAACQSACPYCGVLSGRVHSHYHRHPRDVPLSGRTVQLDIRVRRFFCDNVGCQAATFGERMPELIAPHAHRTTRLAHQQQQVALESGGEAGVRVLKRLGMPTSADTLLRLIRKVSQPEAPTPRVLGVDDWAKSKGQSYGTLLVDLERHQPVDVLPERSAASLEAWLKTHPGVEIISRDRGNEYIKGATEGAPNALQVADRWHLLKNLRDALEELLSQHPACLQAAADTSTASEEVKRPSAPVAEESVSTCYTMDSVPSHWRYLRLPQWSSAKQERQGRCAGHNVRNAMTL